MIMKWKWKKVSFVFVMAKTARNFNNHWQFLKNVDTELVDKAEELEKSVVDKVDITINDKYQIITQPESQSDRRDEENAPIISPANNTSINLLKTLGFCAEETRQKT